MDHYRDIHALGLRRFAGKKYILWIISLIVLFFFLINIGINNYKAGSEERNSLLDFESKMFLRMFSYSQYGLYGVRLPFNPSPISILFRENLPMMDLSARVDSLITVDISTNAKGKSLFKSSYANPLSFSGFILFIGTLLGLFLGYSLVHNQEFLKFLTASASTLKTLAALIGSWLVILFLVLLSLFAVIVLSCLLRGLNFSQKDILHLLIFLGLSFLLLSVSLIMGCVIGSFKGHINSSVTVFIVWFTFILFLPNLLNTFTQSQSNKLQSIYQLKLDKLSRYIEFEKQAQENYGDFNRNQMLQERKIIEEFWDNDRKEIEAFETNFMNDLRRHIDSHQLLTILFPTTFFQDAASEISSMGYDNYLQFYEYAALMQRDFLRFYIDRYYYNDPKKIIAFNKSGNSTYNADSRLPSHFGPGIAITLIYLLGLFFVAHSLLKKKVAQIEDNEEKKTIDKIIDIKGGKLNIFRTRRKILAEELYRQVSRIIQRGKRVDDQPILSITIDGKPVEQFFSGQDHHFVYLCHPSQYPDDITPKALAKYILSKGRHGKTEREQLFTQLEKKHGSLINKPFYQLKIREKISSILTILPFVRGTFFVLDNLVKDMPISVLIRFKEAVDNLVQKGGTVIYITSELTGSSQVTPDTREIIPSPAWAAPLDTYKAFIDDQDLDLDHMYL